MSKIIKKLFPEHTIIGNKISPRSGAFEVSMNEKIVFSKFETGNFPNENDIRSWFK